MSRNSAKIITVDDKKCQQYETKQVVAPGLDMQVNQMECSGHIIPHLNINVVLVIKAVVDEIMAYLLLCEFFHFDLRVIRSWGTCTTTSTICHLRI
jgi:hypothetical protein